MGDFNEEQKWIVAAEKLEIFKDQIELIREDLWVCTKEGHRELKWIKNLNRKRELRAITRIGLLLEDGKWYCKEFCSTHSHPLVIAGHRQFISSN
ncbi:hypothetical protein G4B88_022174 [Cannabis sativa]|uniref:Uncharacterized protein n=1 Tax=Cannabis sativa TaxID=3483 RepID=A0A7J6FIT7_CANSA|nr:hypothetical protein G4B88_022174 [Cannabis sativa]